jgi:arylsulfatase A-like enzyme
VFNPTPERVQNYHECLTAADVGVGRILDRLDQLGLATNTMVVVLGDNGYYLGAHGLDDKRTLYEESLRIPMLVRYPRLITQPAVRDDLVLNIDIAPTILDLAGVPVPAEMQGQSWRPLLGGGAVTNWRQTFLGEYILEPGYEQIPTTVTLRATGSKLTLWPGHPEWSEMFDLTTDPYEVTNLFNLPAPQAMREALRSEFDRQMRETGLGAQLTPLSFSGGVCQMRVTGGEGPRWELQRSADLQTWTRIGEVKMGGQQATMSDPSAGTTKNFYRLEWIGD